jgi:DNA-binding GntR family transcriptional regulator
VKTNKSLREDVFKKILNDIVYGRLSSGEKLTEDRLARKYNVSRTPVREAIFQLEREGYVVHKNAVGAIVRKITFQEVEDSYEVISLLEARAVQLVTSRGVTEKEKDHLRCMITKMEELAKNRMYAQYMTLNIKFHEFFTDQCSNKVLKYVVQDLRRRVYHIATMGITVPQNIELYMHGHRIIYESVINGDADNAYLHMRNHTQDQKRLLKEEMTRIFGRTANGF